MCPSVYDISYPEIGYLCYEDGETDIGVDEIPHAKTIFKDEYDNEEYKLSNYAEPIYFYNAAKRVNDIDIAFLYFYKILEFFFIICQRNAIKQDVDDFISNNNLEHFIDCLQTDYFGKKEDLLLNQLIDAVDCKVIEEVRNLAFTHKLILQNDNKEFSNQLYLHRNSIVHGKFEFKNLQLKMPNKVDDKNSRVWTEIIEKVSFHLIRMYCYEK